MDHSAELLRPARAPARPSAGASRREPAGRRDDIADVGVPPQTTLSVCAIGLAEADRAQLDWLFARGASQSPQLAGVAADAFATADVILINGCSPAARQWWRAHREVLHRRPMVWLDQRSPYEAHTTLVRPVAWSLLPLLLYRAALAAPERRALAPRQIGRKAAAIAVVAPRGIAGAQLRWMLESLGYRATVAARVREGLAALHAAPYDGVILAADSTGPSFDVSAVCRRIRAAERGVGRLPVLVLNQDPTAWQRLRARLSGQVAFAAWPTHAQQLQALLDGLPDARHAARRRISKA